MPALSHILVLSHSLGLGPDTPSAPRLRCPALRVTGQALCSTRGRDGPHLLSSGCKPERRQRSQVLLTFALWRNAGAGGAKARFPQPGGVAGPVGKEQWEECRVDGLHVYPGQLIPGRSQQGRLDSGGGGSPPLCITVLIRPPWGQEGSPILVSLEVPLAQEAPDGEFLAASPPPSHLCYSPLVGRVFRPGLENCDTDGHPRREKDEDVVQS